MNSTESHFNTHELIIRDALDIISSLLSHSNAHWIVTYYILSGRTRYDLLNIVSIQYTLSRHIMYSFSTRSFYLLRVVSFLSRWVVTYSSQFGRARFTISEMHHFITHWRVKRTIHLSRLCSFLLMRRGTIRLFDSGNCVFSTVEHSRCIFKRNIQKASSFVLFVLEMFHG